jgi:enoyl-CoA hydratase
MTVEQSLDASVQSMMVMERLAVGVTLQSDDAAEGVGAFLGKREPKWTGR